MPGCTPGLWVDAEAWDEVVHAAPHGIKRNAVDRRPIDAVVSCRHDEVIGCAASFKAAITLRDLRPLVELYQSALRLSVVQRMAEGFWLPP